MPGAGSDPEPCARGSLSTVFEMKGAGQSSARLPRHSRALPRSPLPSRAAGMGQLRQVETDLPVVHPVETPSRSAICWVLAMQPWELLELPSHRYWRQWRASAPSRLSSLFPGWLGMPLPRAMRESLPKKSWLILYNLIVTEMRNNKRVSPRKACFLNHYSIVLLHGTEKITPGAFSSFQLSGSDDRVGALCGLNPVKSSSYVHKQFKYL